MSGDAWEAPASGAPGGDVIDPRPAQRGWTYAAVTAFATQAACLAVLALTEVLELAGLVSFQDEGPMATALTLVTVVMGLLLILVALLVIVSRVGWTWASVRHARAVGLDMAQHTPGWSGAMWIIPIANLFMPLRIVQQLVGSAAKEGDAVATRLGAWLLPWWVLHMAAAFIDRALLRSAFQDPPPATTPFDLFASAILCLSALADVAVVWRVHRILAPRAP